MSEYSPNKDRKSGKFHYLISFNETPTGLFALHDVKDHVFIGQGHLPNLPVASS